VRVNARLDGHGLLEPISEAEPCGKNLDDTDALGAFDLYQIFGQASLEPEPGETRKNRPPNWGEIKDLALETLKTSKDLRLLAHLGCALLRTDGVPAFTDTLEVASQWLEQHWDGVYPLVDEDAIFRRNALNCFSDPAAVVDGLRRAPLVSSRQHGRFSLRDLDLAAGQGLSGQSEDRPDIALINAAFAAAPIEELRALSDAVSRGLNAVSNIDAIMRHHAGVDAAPSVEQLSTQLKKIDGALRSQLAVHPSGGGGVEASEEEASAEGNGAGAVVAVGSIKSREDAIRALDAAAEFFRRNEPSSPVPLFLERAKRLVAKDFLEVLADIAPDALPQARSAGGLKDE
jgi:type VI secretion system protein ImpA